MHTLSFKEHMDRGDSGRLGFLIDTIKLIIGRKLGSMIVDRCYLAGPGTHERIIDEINTFLMDVLIIGLCTGMVIGIWAIYLLAMACRYV